MFWRKGAKRYNSISEGESHDERSNKTYLGMILGAVLVVSLFMIGAAIGKNIPSHSTFMGDWPCFQTKDKGLCPKGANQKPETRWYFDKGLQTCLAFIYEGCGGNDNNFKSRSECFQCLPADLSCPNPEITMSTISYEDVANQMPHGDCMLPGNPCPKGFSCEPGWPFSHCCNSDILAVYNVVYSDSCPTGEPAYRFFNGEYMEDFVGATCDDLMCPVGYACKKVNAYFSKCCKTGCKQTKDGYMVC